ncbi:MAG: V-type ATP synthase subunit F [Lentisphaeria bacterium]
MSAYCIADEDTVRGFRLAGIDGQAVAGTAEAAAAFGRAVADAGCDLLILGGPAVAGIRAPVERLRLECDRPLVVELPAAAGGADGRLGLRRLVREAVGIHLDNGEDR